MCLLVLLMVILIAAAQGISARRHLLRGAADLDPAIAALKAPLSLRSPAVRRSVRLRLVQSRDEFAAARGDLWLWSPLMTRLGWLPGVGPQVASAPPAADAAFYTTRAAVHLVDGLEPIWPLAGNRQGQGHLLPRVAAALQAEHPQFVAARDDADQAQRALGGLPVHSGSASLDRAGARLRRHLPQLRATSLWLSLAPSLLGWRDPARYLVTWQDPAELRATGGFIGVTDFITVRRGILSNVFAGRTPTAREFSGVPAPLPESMYTYETALLLCDSNWSPDFPLSARLGRWLYAKDTGRWADGVVSVLDTETPNILRAVGPVYLPEYRLWVNAGNLTPLAQHYVNGRYWGPAQRGAPDTLRKQFLAAVIRALLQRIQALPLDRWPALGAALTDAVSRRAIMLYHGRPAVEAAIRAGHADGAMRPVPGDYLQIVDDNRSYSKLNPYVREQATYDVAVLPNLWLDATLTIHYHVNPSPPNLLGFGPEYGDLGTKHDYQDFLRVYVPRGAHLLQMSGVDLWAPQPAYGFTQFAGRLLIRQNRDATVTIKYLLPANAVPDAGRYGLTVRPQQGGNLTAIRVRVQGVGGVRVASARDRTLPLARDAHLDLPLDGSIRPQPVRLPAATGPVDPYIPFRALRDSGHRL